MNATTVAVDWQRAYFNWPLRAMVTEMREHLTGPAHTHCDREIARHAHAHPGAKRMKEIVGIGTLTASAAAATVVDAKSFRCGRQFAAWLG